MNKHFSIRLSFYNSRLQSHSRRKLFCFDFPEFNYAYLELNVTSIDQRGKQILHIKEYRTAKTA